MSTPDFSDLTPFLSDWGLPDAHARLAKRMSSNMEEIRAFYDAIVPRLEAIIDFLNQYPVDAIPKAHLPLAYTALAACEIDAAVNVWQAPELDYASDIRDWRVKRSYTDYR